MPYSTKNPMLLSQCSTEHIAVTDGAPFLRQSKQQSLFKVPPIVEKNVAYSIWPPTHAILLDPASDGYLWDVSQNEEYIIQEHNLFPAHEKYLSVNPNINSTEQPLETPSYCDLSESTVSPAGLTDLSIENSVCTDPCFHSYDISAFDDIDTGSMDDLSHLDDIILDSDPLMSDVAEILIVNTTDRNNNVCSGKSSTIGFGPCLETDNFNDTENSVWLTRKDVNLRCLSRKQQHLRVSGESNRIDKKKVSNRKAATKYRQKQKMVDDKKQVAMMSAMQQYNVVLKDLKAKRKELDIMLSLVKEIR